MDVNYLSIILILKLLIAWFNVMSALFGEYFWLHRDPATQQWPLIGSYGHQYCPVEILAALELDSVNFIIGGNEEYQTRGIDYLNPTACVYSRHMIGYFEQASDDRTNGIPDIEAMIHSNYCSGDYHSIEILKKYFNVKAFAFPVPYKPTRSAFKFVCKGLVELVEQLSSLSGMEYEPARLFDVFDQSNRLADAFAEYSRASARGYQRLADFYEVELAPWSKKLDLLKKKTRDSRLDGGKDGNEGGGFNVVLTGSPVMLGDAFGPMLDKLDLPIRFHDFHFGDQRSLKKIPGGPQGLEKLAGEVDFNDPLQVYAAYLLESLAPERMVSGLADHLTARIQHAIMYEQFLEPGERIEGIIHHTLKFCDVYGTDRALFKSKVQQNHAIPVLDIERDYSRSSIGQLSTRVEAFIEILEGNKNIKEGGS